MNANISVLILTLNEEKNLANCLESLKWCDDVVVLDSYSIDNTKTIGHKYGTRFFQRKFDNYACQRNYGLSNIEYKHSWILMVDADEIVPPELVHEIVMEVSRNTSDISLYRLRIKYFFMNKWLRYSSGYPTWYGRLVKKGHAIVEGSINEHCITSDEIGYLKNHLFHYPFNKGFHAWFEKHNRYSSMEADALTDAGNYPVKFADLFSADPLNRRKATKTVMYKLPGRPILMFLSLLIVRKGFLDGRAGITFCILRMIYEYMIDLKIKEIKNRNKIKKIGKAKSQ